MKVWDVQHGLAIHVETPNGRMIVVDLGVGDITAALPNFSPIRYLASQGISTIDYLIVTHPHRDHLDDILNLNPPYVHVLHRPRHLNEPAIRSGNRTRDSEVITRFLQMDAHFVNPVPAGSSTGTPANFGGVEIAFFQPTSCPLDNLNDHSTVVFFRYAGRTVLVPGDNESPSWRELLAYRAFRDWLQTVNVMIAPHHGREAGYCEDLFEICSPQLVIASDGPGSDTSAVQKYRTKSAGWPVRSRANHTHEDRFVLTTHHDGTIQIAIDWLNGVGVMDVSRE